MHVIIDFNCLSSCLSCLIKYSLDSVLFSEVQWLKHTHGKTPLSGIISTTDEHGFARKHEISVLISAISGNICPTNLTDLHGYAEDTQFADSTILHESTSKFWG